MGGMLTARASTPHPESNGIVILQRTWPTTLVIELRVLDRRDLEALQALEQRCHPFPWARQQLLDELEHGDAVVVGAFDNDDAGTLVGHLVLRTMADDELWILNIATDPQHRRAGIATALMQRAESTARALSVRLWLEVRESNTGAIALYERHGLATVGRRPGYYRAVPPSTTREAAILMSRSFVG